MEQKIDLRIIKTNRNIRSAFIELLNEKEFHAVTVQDILDRALINRSTFYKHYSDKYALAEAIAQEFLDGFRSMTRIDFSDREDFYRMMKKWDETFEKFYKQRMLILGLWKIRTDNIHVYDDMTEILKQQYFLLASSHVRENYNINYQACIFSSVTMVTLKFMMENEETYTAHELIEELQKYYGIISIAPPETAAQ